MGVAVRGGGEAGRGRVGAEKFRILNRLERVASGVVGALQAAGMR